MEKLVHKKLVSFLEKNKLLYHRQFGFRSKHSTVHGLFTITEDLKKKTIDGRKINLRSIYLPTKGIRYNRPWYPSFKKLKFYGFRGLTNDWFLSIYWEENNLLACREKLLLLEWTWLSTRISSKINYLSYLYKWSS